MPETNIAFIACLGFHICVLLENLDFLHNPTFIYKGLTLHIS